MLLRNILVGLHVSLKDMCDWIKYLTLGHFSLEDIFYWKICHKLLVHIFIYLSVCVSVLYAPII